MNISLIIGHRENSEERKNNLLYLIAYYSKLFTHIHNENKQFNFDIWIIEQDKESKILNIQLHFKNSTPIIHQFCYNISEYNRSWSANVGIKLCNSDIAIYCDNDVIMPKDTIMNALAALTTSIDEYGHKYDIYIPYENFIDLSQENTKKWKTDGKLNFTCLTCRYGTTSDKIGKFGGVYFVKRDFFMSIGGMDENFEYYGAEDDEFAYRYGRILESKGRNYTPRSKTHNIYHLYHERLNVEIIRVHPGYNKNCDIMNKTKEMPFSELLNKIENMKSNMGNINKYRR